MSETIIAEWYFWLVSILTGAVMAFVYDLLRLFRRLVRHNRLFVDVEDLLFWTACFFASFTLLYYGNNGVIRFAAVLGAGIGMLVYGLTFGRIFVKYSYLIIIKLLTPIGKVLKKLCDILTKILLFIRIRLTKVTNHLKIIYKYALKAKKGKGETEYGKKHKKKVRKQKKNTGVSPRPK